jgi:glycosyltransferase involved in cell wall biosynthesis
MVLRLYSQCQIVACSPSTKNDLVLNGLPNKNLHVILPGIEDDFLKFHPTEQKFANPTVVCISRFRRYKGLHYAIRTMRFILEKVPNAKLIIAGNGDPSEIKEELARSGYEGSVTIMVRPPNRWNNEKRTLLSRAHLLLVPSVREGYGMVVIEANACGIPAIGWNVPGLRDSILDSKTGFLVPYGDVLGLAEKMITVLRNNYPTEDVKSSGLQWARTHSWDRSARQFENLIESVIK